MGVDTLPGPRESASVQYLACTEEIGRLLEQINAIRAEGANCVGSYMEPVSSLRPNPLLEHAAFEHAYSMATHNFLSHTGRDGRDVGQRVSSYGYHWRLVGENIAAGQPSVDKAVEEWLESAEHCRNLMSAEYRETGFACVANPRAEYRYYWVQVFATSME
ncbi:CAP domain-containing protein [Ferrimonas sediminicola]|nr:CAP domain-containing protein [Ferrimonas sediminicola]